MSFFSKGSDAAITAANRTDKAETADALRRQAVFQLQLGNHNTAIELDDQARALED